MIASIAASEVLASCRQILGIPGEKEAGLDDLMLAALTRRSAGVHCPCSRATLRTSLVECTRHLPNNYDSLPDALDSAIEALIVSGDLLELNDVVTEESATPRTWVFAAPPCFVLRPSGSAFLFGIVPDQDTFLPSMLASRVRYRGFTRLLEPSPGEDLTSELQELGLQQLSDSAWLRSPRTEHPAALVDRYQRLLANQARVLEMPDLQVLDSSLPATYYRGRWTDPHQPGRNICRTASPGVRCPDLVHRRTAAWRTVPVSRSAATPTRAGAPAIPPGISKWPLTIAGARHSATVVEPIATLFVLIFFHRYPNGPSAAS